MRIAVVQFPGSNCDRDTLHAVTNVMGVEGRMVWHKESLLGNVDGVIIPGGFSYGDYLRCGAIARFSPIMKSVVQFANQGGPVLGICNGFQVLVEAGLLTGALLRNKNLKFLCQPVHLRVENPSTPFTKLMNRGDILTLPIAHGEGNYYADDKTIKLLEDRGQIVFRYVSENGETTEDANPNGSKNSIAGICNEKGNVVGLMPHPERASELLLGSKDGKKFFDSLYSLLSPKEHRPAQREEMLHA